MTPVFSPLLVRLKPHWPLALLMLATAFSRWPALWQHIPGWDEISLIAVAKLPLSQMLWIGALRDHHPLFFWLPMHIWIALFGDQEPWIRLYAYGWGLLGVGLAYGLAKHISGSRQAAFFTGLMCVFSPFPAQYASLGTNYNIYFAAVLGSWLCLLKALELLSRPCQPAATELCAVRSHESGHDGGAFWKCGWVWGYAGFTFLVMQAHASGAHVVPCQLLYVLCFARLVAQRYWRSLLILAGMLLVPFLPFVWLAAQPWHFSKAAAFQQGFAPVDAFSLLFAPANLLWLGYDSFNLGELKEGLPLTLTLVITWLLVWLSGMVWVKRRPQQRFLMLSLGLLPVLLLWLAHVLFFAPGSKGVFHFRAFLYAAFPLHLLLAVWINQWRKPFLPVVAVFLILLVQQTLPFRFSPWAEKWEPWGALIRANYQPGDGILVYPGFYYISLLRSFDPPRFALSTEELAVTPGHNNILQMVNIDDGVFLGISDKTVLAQPETARRLHRFVAEHPRIWLMVQDDLDRFTPFLSVCGKTFLYPNYKFEVISQPSCLPAAASAPAISKG